MDVLFIIVVDTLLLLTCELGFEIYDVLVVVIVPPVRIEVCPDSCYLG
jgi:hypothetical protein